MNQYVPEKKLRDNLGKIISIGDKVAMQTGNAKVVEAHPNQQIIGIQFEDGTVRSIKSNNVIKLDFDTEQYVVVYGSLLSNLSNFGFLHIDSEHPSEFHGPVNVSGFDMYPISDHFPWNYPFCIEGEGTITGEMYKVSPFTMAYLDNLEGYPNMYSRKKVEVNGELAHIYYMNPEQANSRQVNSTSKVPDGDWRNYLVKKLAGYIMSIKNPIEYEVPVTLIAEE